MDILLYPQKEATVSAPTPFRSHKSIELMTGSQLVSLDPAVLLALVPLQQLLVKEMNVVEVQMQLQCTLLDRLML